LIAWKRESEFARRIAETAGANARAFRARGISAESKADASPVTVADRDNERLIREAIEREFPDDGILGEEGSSKAGTSGRRWIIDPIDGTRDFVRGNRFWCVLVALEEGDESLVGVAHFPMLGETYWAVRGGGSYMNGERLRASLIESVAEAAFQSQRPAPSRFPALDAAGLGPDAALVVGAFVRRRFGCVPDRGRPGGPLV
jgi:fructose-1,6-bisphosphatase/inositol monophosphatase family enzyme